MTSHGNTIVCPECGHSNIEGSDECENCLSDLRTVDIPLTAQPESPTSLSAYLAEVKVSRAVTIEPDAPVSEALALMQREQVEALVVVREGAVVGMFTDRDVLKRVALQDVPAGTAVQALMTPDPVVLRETDTAAVALHKMGTGGFRHIPLTRDGAVVSVVSARDILRWVMGWYLHNG